MVFLPSERTGGNIMKKEIEKVTFYIISHNYAKKPKSLEMLNYLKE